MVDPTDGSSRNVGDVDVDLTWTQDSNGCVLFPD